MAITAQMVKELRESTGAGMMDCKKALQEAEGNMERAVDILREKGLSKAAKKADRIAAEGLVAIEINEDNTVASMVEVNSETDFVARDEGFLGFVGRVADAAFAAKSDDVAALMAGELESAREALVQKIGENIGVRRIAIVSGENVGAYVHSNNRIAVLVAVSGANAEVAKDVAMHVAAVNPQVISKEDMPAEVIQKEKEIILAQPDMASKPAEIAEKMVAGRINKFLAENSLLEQAFVKNPDQKVGEMVKAAGGSVVTFARLEVGEGIEVEKVDFAAEVAAQLKN